MITCYPRTWIDPGQEIAIFHKAFMKIGAASWVPTQKQTDVETPQAEAKNGNEESTEYDKK